MSCHHGGLLLLCNRSIWSVKRKARHVNLSLGPRLAEPLTTLTSFYRRRTKLIILRGITKKVYCFWLHAFLVVAKIDYPFHCLFVWHVCHLDSSLQIKNGICD